jgi:hypothetical protein
LSDVRRIKERLERARGPLLAATEAVPAERWQEHPAPGCWSAAEVIAHLTMVEEAIQQGAEKLFAREPRPVALWRRLHIPPQLVEYRLLKAKTPLPLDSAYVGEKAALLQRIGAVRARTLAILEANGHRDLRQWRWPHPLLGSLNGESWFQMIASHEVRHTKQLREILKALQ